jgi:16S rRNA (uracil1498-N3)-methyltransferase
VNLILIEKSDLDERGALVLGQRRGRHIQDVLRAKPGDEVRIGMIRGPGGTGRVLELRGHGERLEVVLEPRWHDPPSPMPRVELILALPRPKALQRVLQTAACMGVERIHVINAWRVDKSYWQSPVLEPGALRQNLVLGCEQGATTWLPDIESHRLLMPFLQGPLTRRLQARSGPAFITHPGAHDRLETVMNPGTSWVEQPMMVAVGPEGGWIDRERTSFAELGFVEVSLGDPVLRVDTAVTSLLAQVSLLRRLATDRARSPASVDI